jgi:hypothetical protein
MNLKRFIPMFLVSLSLLTTPSFGSSRGSNRTSRSSGSQPYFGGSSHASSHGGSYRRGGSSHKGGHYTSTTGSHRYGRHK